MRRGLSFIAWQIVALFAGVSALSLGQEVEPRNAPKAQARRPAEPAPAGAPDAPAPDPARMEWLLQQWEKQSSLLKSLDVMLSRTDSTPAWGDLEFYEGRALFKAPNLAFIDFNKIEQDEKKKRVIDPKTKKFVSKPYERIVCTGAEVWQYRSDVQQIFVFPLEKDEQQKAIEEGPLPFLFNMRADDAKKRYQMTLISEDEKSFGVSILPKLQVDKESFSRAFVKLDAKYLLPLRIVMVSPDRKSTKDFTLNPSQMYPNKPINEKNFEGRPLGPPWKVIRNPAGEERPRAGLSRKRPEGLGEPAAARPGPASGAQRR
jgi:TIGR03009 family protein